MVQGVLLKKYANRRLYDTNQSAYVTLSEVADMVKQGKIIKVVDAKTKENVTAFILTQILLEEARKKNALLPVPVLHLLIRYGDNLLGEFFEKYLQQTIRNYLAYKAAIDEQFKKWLEVGMDMSDMSQKSMKSLTPLKSFMELFSSVDAQKKESKGE
jgi:polyhydroxyalkanoate synthesis repressor PhaR